MKRFLLLVLISVSAWAQERELLGPDQSQIVGNQETIGTSLGIPVKMNQDGDLSFIDDIEGGMVVAPTILGGLSMKKVTYTAPVQMDSPSFTLPQSASTLSYKSFRYEYGLGLDATIQSSLGLGISPYKGATMLMIQHKTDKNALSHPIRLPKDFNDFQSWEAGDTGIYQTYGGIEIGLSGGFAILNLGASIQIQNQFLITVKKMSDDEVAVTVTEENLHMRKINASITVAKASLAWLQGRRLSGTVRLSFKKGDQKLYGQLLKGKLKTVQDQLPVQKYLVRWEGWEKNFSWGIPAVWKKETTHSEFDLTENGEDAELSVYTRKDQGFARKFISSPVKSISHYVYVHSGELVLFWNMDFPKTKMSLLNSHFVTPIRSMGLMNLEKIRSGDLPTGGRTMAQMGVILKSGDLTQKAFTAEFGNHLAQGCRELKLTCSDPKFRAGIVKKLLALAKGGPKKFTELGRHLMNHPILLGGLIRTQKLTRPLFFKVLSENFQSFQGEVALD